MIFDPVHYLPLIERKINALDQAAPLADWDNYLHLRDNPAGVTRDLWYHETGCGSWLLVTRNTVTHEILATERVADRRAQTK